MAMLTLGAGQNSAGLARSIHVPSKRMASFSHSFLLLDSNHTVCANRISAHGVFLSFMALLCYAVPRRREAIHVSFAHFV